MIGLYLSDLREAFFAGMDAGVDFADSHDPDDGYSAPKQEDRERAFQTWLLPATEGAAGPAKGEGT